MSMTLHHWRRHIPTKERLFFALVACFGLWSIFSLPLSLPDTATLRSQAITTERGNFSEERIHAILSAPASSPAHRLPGQSIAQRVAEQTQVSPPPTGSRDVAIRAGEVWLVLPPEKMELPPLPQLFEYDEPIGAVPALPFQHRARPPDRRRVHLTDAECSLVDAAIPAAVAPDNKAAVRTPDHLHARFELWAQQLAKLPAEQRRTSIQDFIRQHEARIINRESHPDGFSPRERAEFAAYVRGQYAFARNRNPQDAAIHRELVATFARLGAVDAELGACMDAVRDEISEPDCSEMRLRAGEIMVRELGLYAQAQTWLEAVQDWGEARLLMAEALAGQQHYEQAAVSAEALAWLLERPLSDAEQSRLRLRDASAPASLALRDAAWLVVARNQVARGHLRAAIDALARVAVDTLVRVEQPASAQKSSARNQADVMLAGILLYRGGQGDAASALKLIEGNPELSAIVTRAQRGEWTPATAQSASPLVAATLVAWAVARTAMGTDSATPGAEVYAVLDAAVRADPLAIDGALVRGQLLAREGRYGDALKVLRDGLAANPGSARLHYAIGSILQRAERLELAWRHFDAVLLAEPGHYPALNRLGEIELALAQGQAQGYQRVHSYWSKSLAIREQQPALRAALAGISLRLAAATEHHELRKSHLALAREYGRLEIAELKRQMTAHDKDSLAAFLFPSLDGYAVHAAATWEMGLFHAQPELLATARLLLEEMLELAQDGRAFSSPQTGADFRAGPQFAWAQRTLAALKANQRQRLRRDDFGRTAADGSSSIGNRWQRFDGDTGTQVGMRDGVLHLGVYPQHQPGAISRLSREEGASALTRFSASMQITDGTQAVGGIHVTRMQGGTMLWSLCAGINGEGQVVYDLRVPSANEATEQSAFATGPCVLGMLGPDKGSAPDPQGWIRLGLSRRTESMNNAKVAWTLHVGTKAVALDFSGADARVRDALEKAEGLGADDEQALMRIGFFVYAPVAQSGSVAVDECEWVLDSEFAPMGK